MEKKQFLYLRFKPCTNPDKRLISEISSCPFDYIFTPTASQDEIYTKFKSISDNFKLGKSSCIVLIGNSHSGRRYSLFGKHPSHNGILTRIIEEVLQIDTENEFRLYFSKNKINNSVASANKDLEKSRILINSESTFLELSESILGEKEVDEMIYQLALYNNKTSTESELTAIFLQDTPLNLQVLSTFLKGVKNSSIPISSLLNSYSSVSDKFCILFSCKEEKSEILKIKEVFFPEPKVLESQSSEITETLTGNELEELKKKNTQLTETLLELTNKLLAAEKRAHEYYECYHKTLLLINKDSAQNIYLNSQNESLIRQIRKETSILQSLESKYQGLFETCTRSHESTHIEFNACSDSLLKNDRSMELNVTDTLNLGISIIKLNLAPDPSLFSPYSSELKQALEGNTELNKEIQILQLKNQLIEASVINANLSRMLCSFEWKHAMLKHRYEMKRLLSKQQQERIKSLEEMLEHLHLSSQNIVHIASGENKAVEKLFEKYCYKSIVDSQRIVAEYKRIIQSIEAKVTESHRKEAQKWMELIQDHKENYEKELNRKQGEVVRLNELLGKWINKYMELQENLETCEKPLSIVYYNEIQEIIHETIHKGIQKINGKQITPKAKPQCHAQKFGIISGDVQPPN